MLILLAFLGCCLSLVGRLGNLILLSSPLLIAGCGPLQQPMAARPDEETQKKINEAWDNALAPVDQLDRQQWLDAFTLTFAFEAGVDRMAFHSEKEFSGGLVVMEVHYDRKKPDEDRFEVTVVDHAGNRLRHERYSRQEVEQTYRFFYDELAQADPNRPQPPHAARKRQERIAREKVIEELFPKPQEREPKAKPKP